MNPGGKKARSFKNILKIDSADIIEIDMDKPLDEQSLRSSKPGEDSEFSRSLKSLQAKFQPVPRSVIEKVQTYESIEEVPSWTGLATALHFSGASSFEWISQLLPDTGGLIHAVKGIKTGRPAIDIFSGMMYWEYTSTDEGLWALTLRNIYFAFTGQSVPYFYVQFRKFLAFFSHTEEGPTATIVNPNTVLKSKLMKRYCVHLDHEEIEPIKLVHTQTPPLVIRGKSINAFYNYLVNAYNHAKIFSPQLFLNATLRTLNVTYNGKVLVNGENLYKVDFEGPATRDMLMGLINVLVVDSRTLHVNLARSPLSEKQDELFPSQIRIEPGKVTVHYF